MNNCLVLILTVILSLQTGSGLNRRVVATSRSTSDLNMQLNKLMFDSDSKPVAICKHQGTFTMVMASLTHYEKQVISIYCMYKIVVFSFNV